MINKSKYQFLTIVFSSLLIANSFVIEKDIVLTIIIATIAIVTLLMISGNEKVVKIISKLF